MKIFMWSGPRSISTALMRSFENRNDTFVLDEPFYSYYLNETSKKHPMNKEIIKQYNINQKKIIKLISSKPPNNKKIFFQKHMAHHIINRTSLNWTKLGTNCFLIRDPKEVLLSYIKKNNLFSSNDLGFPILLNVFQKIKSKKNKIIIIDTKKLLENPKKNLINLCKELKIPFTNKMLKWKKGLRNTDGIWSKVWYENVINSNSFYKYKKNYNIIPRKYEKIYDECNEIYKFIKSSEKKYS